MKKIFLSILCGLFLATGVLSASAQENSNLLPLTQDNYDDVLTKNNIITQIVDTEEFGEKTETSLRAIFRGNKEGGRGIIFNINMVLGAIAILFMAILGLKFVVSQGDEDHMTKYKQQFSWMILGLAVISVAEFFAFEFLDPVRDTGGVGILNTSDLSNAFYEKIQQVKLFIEIVVVGIVLIKMLMSGYSLIVRSEQDEAISQEKTFFRSFLFGTILILLAEVIARILSASKLNTRSSGSGNAGEVVNLSNIDLATIGDSTKEAAETGISEIVGLVNFSLSFLAVMTVIMLILASVYYVMSFGNEDQMSRAKRIVVSCAIGAIVAVSAFTIARFAIG